MKKMMKAIVLLTCFSVVACGNDNNGATNNAKTNNKTSNGNNGTSTGNNGSSAGNNGTSTGNNGSTAGNNATSTGNNGTTTANNGTTTAVELPLGADCTINDTCMNGHCAPKDQDFCDGICTEFLATGDMCGAIGTMCDFRIDQCDLGLFETVCKTVKVKGEVCDLAGQCGTETYCKIEAGMDEGTCSDRIGLEQPCPQNFGCAEEFYCDSLADAPTCKAKAALGDACDKDALFPCLGLKTECNDSGVCVARTPITCD